VSTSKRVRRVHSDTLKSYFGLSSDYVHNVIDHAECYAKGNVHTNGQENFWPLLKRSIKRTCLSVEPFQLFRYLDEQAFRFNNQPHWATRAASRSSSARSSVAA
jgi:hypothetical protein